MFSRSSFFFNKQNPTAQRVRHFAEFFQHKTEFKKTFLISLGLFVSVGGVYVATHLQQNVSKYHAAYQNIPKLVSERKWKHKIESEKQSEEESSSKDDNENQTVHQFPFSHESITLIDASKTENAKAYSSSSNKTENLGSLSNLNWPEFIDGNESEDDIFSITIGVRRAFGENSPIHKLGFTHAVVLVEKKKKKKNNKSKNNTKKEFAIYGYNAGKLTGRHPLFMLNDMNNVGVTQHFTFYNELTIQGTRKQAVRVFNRIEEAADKPYKVFTCNCFSPIFTAMLEEANNSKNNNSERMKIPEHFMESLSICVPTEQNFGFGMSSNSEIKPYAELASAAVNVAVKRKLVKVAIDEEEEKGSKK